MQYKCVLQYTECQVHNWCEIHLPCMRGCNLCYDDGHDTKLLVNIGGWFVFH